MLSLVIRREINFKRFWENCDAIMRHWECELVKATTLLYSPVLHTCLHNREIFGFKILFNNHMHILSIWKPLILAAYVWVPHCGLVGEIDEESRWHLFRADHQYWLAELAVLLFPARLSLYYDHTTLWSPLVGYPWFSSAVYFGWTRWDLILYSYTDIFFWSCGSLDL